MRTPDERPRQYVTTDIGGAWVFANGDSEYAFHFNDYVNRVPIEATVHYTVTPNGHQRGPVYTKRTDKAAWDQPLDGGISDSARDQILRAAVTAILSVAGPEMNRRATLARRRLQLETATDPQDWRRKSLVERRDEAQAALDAFDADIEQMKADIARLESEALTPTG